MAFTGVAVVTQVSDGKVRITGLSLAGAAAGTIALSGGTTVGATLLPASFKASPYRIDGGTAGGNVVALQDAIECRIVLAGSAVATAQQVAVTKTGTTQANFLITLTNAIAATATDALEIWVQFH